MALIECRFYSEVLNREASMYVIIPTASFEDVLQKKDTKIQQGAKFRTLYLLHGLGQNYTSWIRNTSIERYAKEKKIAVVMPDAGNSLYANMVHGSSFWSFISEELPLVCRALFPLSDQRKDNFVAGASMGGYGAFKLALLKSDRFAAAASLSGTPDISPMVHMAKQIPSMRKLMENAFGDSDSILGSENDLIHVLKGWKEENGDIPRLYLSGGRQDQGYPMLLKSRDDIRDLGFDLTYEEMEGGHDWEFWDKGILRVLDWMLGE